MIIVLECFRARIIDIRVCCKTDSPGSRNSVGGLVPLGYKGRLGGVFHLHRNTIPDFRGWDTEREPGPATTSGTTKGY